MELVLLDPSRALVRVPSIRVRSCIPEHPSLWAITRDGSLGLGLVALGYERASRKTNREAERAKCSSWPRIVQTNEQCGQHQLAMQEYTE